PVTQRRVIRPLMSLSMSSRRLAFSLSFFFSSRRRHTRSKRDWSSDVCSSDLHCQSTYKVWMYRGLFPLEITYIPWHVLQLNRVTSLQDRKSTRLNSSHVSISYAVFS